MVAAALRLLQPTLNHLQKSPMQDIMFREITGNNIPHVLIVRNDDELVEQSICQFGNTAAFFGTGSLLSKGLDVFPGKLYKTLGPVAKNWFHLGKSLAILTVLGACMWGSPMLRNYVTSKRTGTTDFARVVGERSRGGMTAEEKLRQAKQTTDYMKRLGRIMGIGLAAAGIFLGGAHGLIRNKIPFSRIAKFVNTHIGLDKGAFGSLKDASAFLFWTLPTYIGLFQGSRDKFEFKEILLRFGVFNAAFFILPKAVEHMLKKMLNPKSIKALGSMANAAYLGKFISSIIFCSTIPTALNIYLTRKRVAKEDHPGRKDTVVWDKKRDYAAALANIQARLNAMPSHALSSNRARPVTSGF